METHLAASIRDTPAGREAGEILRKCVHCGFCTAVCPTYQLLGDELSGPRGRIYLIKNMLEGNEVSGKTRRHLDSCLTCRSCESACPSGVDYARLLEIGRSELERRLPRTTGDALLRSTLRNLLPRPRLFGFLMRVGQLLRPLMPPALRRKTPPRSDAGAQAAAPVGGRRMLLLSGCAQPAMYPNINGAAKRVMARLGVAMIEAHGAGCCGAVRLHLNDAAGARDDARRNLAAWKPYLDSGVEAIVMTASACALQVRDYQHLLRDDPQWADDARRAAQLARDVSEVVAAEQGPLLSMLRGGAGAAPLLAFHAPCTLQHGLRLGGVVESILAAAGFRLASVTDSHLCCGSAGTYSILQAQLSERLRDDKLASLLADRPDGVASANVGCIAHLQPFSPVAVKHWVEWLDERLEQVCGAANTTGGERSLQ